MRTVWIAIALACAAGAAGAQQPDSTRRRPAPSDSAARADSAAAADSAALVREFEHAQGAQGAQGDTSRPPAAAPAQGAPINPRLLPDVSAVGDLIGDLSPKGSTQEDGTRFGVREIEVALQAAVDPYFRGDVFLGISDAEGIAVEQAYLTATALPWGLEARLGRYLMPIGKQNTTHRHDLHTIEYPYVIQRFFSPEGLKGTGVYVSKIASPFGFYQELIVTGVNRFGEAPDGLQTAEPVNKQLSGMGYSARLRNYWDLSEASNIELSFSGITGDREQPILGLPDEPNAVAARQSVIGTDFTYRWRPLQQGLYKSFILQAEVMRQLNERRPDLPSAAIYEGPKRDNTGAYLFARWQLTRRLYLGGRYDYLQDPLANGERLDAASGYLEFFPSEFSKLMVGYERTMPSAGYRALGIEGSERLNRILLQATFALGPHKPHPF
ncbi:MAG TPA: hypothetical protein VFS05_06145 [Gemmatimonadaceae bacterium]|nr:hypothetical protein [Gemmatimonadaceae bacterium]